MTIKEFVDQITDCPHCGEVCEMTGHKVSDQGIEIIGKCKESNCGAEWKWTIYITEMP